MSSHGRTVLIVDDNPDHHAICAAILGAAGFATVHAYDGVEGVRLAIEHHPDVVLMDLWMPRLDGIEATRALRGHPDTSGIPVIATTADVAGRTTRRSGVSSPQELMDRGFTAFLPKPCEPRRIVAEVERVLQVAER